jgi:release factor glutamine methyltransferase
MMECKIIASDISHVALDTAAANARSHGVWDAIEFVESDLFKRVKGRFDLITANPPYIAGSEFAHLQEEVLMEPRNAIDGGADGLDFYRRIAREARGALKKDGCMVLEIGFGQAAAVRDILEQAGGLRVTEVRKDFNGIDRVITCARV